MPYWKPTTRGRVGDCTLHFNKNVVAKTRDANMCATNAYIDDVAYTNTSMIYITSTSTNGRADDGEFAAMRKTARCRITL